MTESGFVPDDQTHTDDPDRDYRIVRGTGGGHYHLEADPENPDRDIFRTCGRWGCDREPRYVGPNMIVDGLPTPEFFEFKHRAERPQIETLEEARQTELQADEAKWVFPEAWLPATALTGDSILDAIKAGVLARRSRQPPRRPDDVKEYHFPDASGLGDVTMRTAHQRPESPPKSGRFTVLTFVAAGG